jgi:hypothetical protein
MVSMLAMVRATCLIHMEGVAEGLPREKTILHIPCAE